jgi:soluble lytic murein transglycosylase-like protein
VQIIWLIALIALWTALPSPLLAGSGSIYKFVDERGVVHFSDQPLGADYRTVPRPPSQIRLTPRYSGYDSLIVRAARAESVDPALVKAVIAAESHFDPKAVSRKGALGLMQLMPQTAEKLGVEDALQPDQNVQGGTRYLRAMLDRYGDLSHALAAYNAGPTAVDRYRGIPPYRETQAYVLRVLDYYHGYHPEFTQ